MHLRVARRSHSTAAYSHFELQPDTIRPFGPVMRIQSDARLACSRVCRRTHMHCALLRAPTNKYALSALQAHTRMHEPHSLIYDLHRIHKHTHKPSTRSRLILGLGIWHCFKLFNSELTREDSLLVRVCMRANKPPKTAKTSFIQNTQCQHHNVQQTIKSA